MANPASLGKRALFSLLLVLGLLGVVELVLRARQVSSVSPFARIAPAIADERAGRYEAHPQRLYTLAPHFRHSPSHLGRDATGDWPFRGRPPEPAPPGLLRVAVIGDSVVYGSSLDAADVPGSCLARSLAERGWTPDRVAVISLGVPGYSTIQLDLLLAEALGTLHPDAVVLWPAAWNDQAPAMSVPDLQLLVAHDGSTLGGWLRNHSRLFDELTREKDDLPATEIIEGWKRNRPPRGTRVPGGFVGAMIGLTLQRCARAGVPIVVLASAHPPQTAAEHPRTRWDADSVLDAARMAKVPAVDAQALLDAKGLDPARCFVDYVHPSPEANALFGAALAEQLGPLLDARAAARGLPPAGTPSASALSILDAQPREVPVLGDATLRVTLSGWTRGETLPAVIVGGAPLIDVRAAGEHEVEGTLMANAPGRHELVVQSATGCAWLPDAIEYREPAIRIEAPPGESARLVVTARPGDGVRVLVAAGRAAEPSWSPRGAYWLDDTARALPGDRVADAQGLALWTFDQAPPGTFLVQALVAPAGEAPDEGLGSRWTSVVELSAPTSSAAPVAPDPSSPGAR
jgi:lysophospholipase L1-like esterase